MSNRYLNSKLKQLGNTSSKSIGCVLKFRHVRIYVSLFEIQYSTEGSYKELYVLLLYYVNFLGHFWGWLAGSKRCWCRVALLVWYCKRIKFGRGFNLADLDDGIFRLKNVILRIYCSLSLSLLPKCRLGYGLHTTV